jgi:catechol 2,3-dioxygenase
MSEAYRIKPPGFRLPATTRVGAVHLQVSDLSRSIAYYEEVIGLRVRDRSERRAELAVADASRPLVTLSAPPGTRVARRGAFGLYHFAILLPDRASLGRFARHVARAGRLSGLADHLVSEALYLSDPDGLGIEVYADRPQTTWRHRGRELVMTSDPLDVDDLMAEAGPAAWDAAPPGTTMGHVHLHVGQLPRAEAYYHAALGLDKVVWSYPGALFLAAGTYHHHLGVNTWSPGPSAAADEARLLRWELVTPDAESAETAAESLRGSGYEAQQDGAGWRSRDPWGTEVAIEYWKGRA